MNGDGAAMLATLHRAPRADRLLSSRRTIFTMDTETCGEPRARACGQETKLLQHLGDWENDGEEANGGQRAALFLAVDR